MLICLFCVSFSLSQIFSNVTQVQFFSANFSLAYRRALESLLSVSPNTDFYRTRQHSIINSRMQSTVEIYCPEALRYWVYLFLVQYCEETTTFQSAMSTQLHYPVLVSTDVQYPVGLSTSTFSNEEDEG